MTVYNMGVPLTAQEQDSYNYWNDVRTSTLARFGADTALAGSCIASKDNRLAYALSMGWNPEASKASKDRWSPQTLGKAANMWLRASKHCEGIVAHAQEKVHSIIRVLHPHDGKAIVYSNSYYFTETLWIGLHHKALQCHGKLTSQQREITTTKHFKTKPDEVTTKLKTVGAATLRKEAVEAFLLPTSPVRVLCLSRLPDYDRRLLHQPLLVECSGNTDIVERLQPQVCVHLFCQGTYEANALLRKQRGQQVQKITNIHQIQLPC